LRTSYPNGSLEEINLRIRAASLRDVGAMHRLRNSVRENRLSEATDISEASYLPYIAVRSAWIAESDAGVAGFAAIDAAAAKVWALFVAPEAEGAGVGRALHDHMLEWAGQQGIESLSLSTEDGSRAVQFYTRAGWKRVCTTADGEVHFVRTMPG
jgi:GNAT superfamily N-acetyltransferase